MPKKPELDESTRQITKRLLNMPPKTHDQMKLGKTKGLPKKAASKGRVHKGRMRA